MLRQRVGVNPLIMRPEQKPDRIVRAPRAVDDDLVRNHRSLAVQEKRLLWRKVPLVPETLVTVARAELPERRIPGCAVAITRAWAGGNQPTLHDFLQKTVCQQTFAIDAAQVFGPEHTAPLLLERAQRVERFSEFFVRCGHDRLGSIQVYCAVRIQVYYDVPQQVNYAV